MAESTKSVTYEKNKPTFKIRMLVWYLVDIIEALLGLRFLLRFLGANPANAFADFIYDLSLVFVGPFLNLFNPITVGNFVIEVSTLFAMLAYWLLAYIISEILRLLLPERRSETVRREENSTEG
jgi:YggT family protein